MGGRSIEDRSFWAGSGGREGPFPMNSKIRSMDSGEGAGELERYEDTEEDIKRSQDLARSKIKSNKAREDYR